MSEQGRPPREEPADAGFGYPIDYQSERWMRACHEAAHIVACLDSGVDVYAGAIDLAQEFCIFPFFTDDPAGDTKRTKVNYDRNRASFRSQMMRDDVTEGALLNATIHLSGPLCAQLEGFDDQHFSREDWEAASHTACRTARSDDEIGPVQQFAEARALHTLRRLREPLVLTAQVLYHAGVLTFSEVRLIQSLKPIRPFDKAE